MHLCGRMRECMRVDSVVVVVVVVSFFLKHYVVGFKIATHFRVFFFSWSLFTYSHTHTRKRALTHRAIFIATRTPNSNGRVFLFCAYLFPIPDINAIGSVCPRSTISSNATRQTFTIGSLTPTRPPGRMPKIELDCASHDSVGRRRAFLEKASTLWPSTLTLCGG